jgi:hypothetical protein
MPHDRDGRLLKASDRVTLEFEIASVGEGETQCNLVLLAVRPPGCSESYLPMLSCNSGMVRRVDVGADEKFSDYLERDSKANTDEPIRDFDGAGGLG